MIEYLNEQGTEEWLNARRGVLTASTFVIARERTAKGLFTARARNLAMDIAYEQIGGVSARQFQSYEMRIGSEQEAIAFAEYENQRFEFPKKTGLIATPDRIYGCSPDGLVNDDGGIEIKTMVSSKTFFECWADENIDEYKDQCMGAMWLLDREWWDLCLFAYGLPEDQERLKIIRIERDEQAIKALTDDLEGFMELVHEYKHKYDKNARQWHNGHQLMDTVKFRELGAQQ